MLYHHSRRRLYRDPPGALPAGEGVTLRVRVRGETAEGVPCAVTLRVWDGGEHRYPMHPVVSGHREAPNGADGCPPPLPYGGAHDTAGGQRFAQAAPADASGFRHAPDTGEGQRFQQAPSAYASRLGDAQDTEAVQRFPQAPSAYASCHGDAPDIKAVRRFAQTSSAYASCPGDAPDTEAILRFAQASSAYASCHGDSPDTEAVRRFTKAAPARTPGSWDALYEARITLPHQPGPIWYVFIAEYPDGRVCVYGDAHDGLGGEGAAYPDLGAPGYQITVYDRGFAPPSWLREGVMYQIFVDRFFDGDASGRLKRRRDDIALHERWEEPPCPLPDEADRDNAALDFFGGNLPGVRAKLPYLKELGVTVLYLNPIFRARTNHKYDTGDYLRIDPMFGDEEAFLALCRDARAAGIRVMLDGVFSHTGDDSRYFNRRGTYDSLGAYQSPDSPYHDWYAFRSFPEDYDCWWGFKTLPNVNEMTPSYLNFMLRGEDAVVRRWLRRGAGGWRLDVADELPMDFLRELRRAVKAQDRDAAVMGEVWEDASNKVAYGELRSYCLGDTLDSVMNYPLREAAIGFFTYEVDAAGFARRADSQLERYPAAFAYSVMNLMGSHDRARIINVLGGAEGEGRGGVDAGGEGEASAAGDNTADAAVGDMAVVVSDRVYEAGNEGVAHASEDDVTHSGSEGCADASEDDVAHAAGGVVASADGDVVTHAGGDDVAHAAGGVVASADGDVVTHSGCDVVTHAGCDVVTHAAGGDSAHAAGGCLCDAVDTGQWRERGNAPLNDRELALGKARLPLLWALICALPGMPALYYGDEAGMTGGADPWCRGTYPWGREDAELLARMRVPIVLRHGHRCLKTGGVRLLAGGDGDVLAVSRWIGESCASGDSGVDVFGQPGPREAMLLVVNRSDSAREITLDAAMLPAEGYRVIQGEAAGPLIGENGRIVIRMLPLSAVWLIGEAET